MSNGPAEQIGKGPALSDGLGLEWTWIGGDFWWIHWSADCRRPYECARVGYGAAGGEDNGFSPETTEKGAGVGFCGEGGGGGEGGLCLRPSINQINDINQISGVKI